MDREMIYDEFGPASPKDTQTTPDYEAGYTPWSVELSLITYQKPASQSQGVYGLYLKRSSKMSEGFFHPFYGAPPQYLYFSIREVDGKRYMFIDERHLPPEGLIKLSRNPSRPLHTHCVPRKVSIQGNGKHTISIPRQIIKIIPEITQAKRLQAVRVPIKGHPLEVRYQIIPIK